MINIPALLNVLRVSTTATDKRSWATKSLAYVTLSGLLMAGLPFIPTEYAQYINADWVNSFCTVAITAAAAFGVFGTTNAGILPAKPEPKLDVEPSVRPEDNGPSA